MQQETERRIVISILKAHEGDGTPDETPWGVTELGWEVYTSHADPLIRAAALKNPYCPAHLGGQGKTKAVKRRTLEKA